jgi:hypothetical protein
MFGRGRYSAALAAGATRELDIRPVRERMSRPAIERVLAVTPALLRFGAAVVVRLPAATRLRRLVLQAAFSRGFAAINRRDPWFIPVAYEPDCEIYSAPEFRTLGLAGCYRGHSGWREITDAITESLPDVRYTPEHLIDLGDRWVLRLVVSGSGRASGAQTRQTWGFVYRLSSRGRIARQDCYLRWEQTLAAAGLGDGR